MHYEIYTIKGRKYKYAVENYREGKKVKHKKTYIGALEPIHKAKFSAQSAITFLINNAKVNPY